MLKVKHVVIVGLGGNYWYAFPRLMTALMMCPERVTLTLVDHDRVEEGNWPRQWPGCKGRKVDLVRSQWGRVLRPKSRVEVAALLIEELEPMEGVEGDVVVICLPDNDKCRHDTTQWLERTMLGAGPAYTGAILVAGTDWDGGQAYYGFWENGEWKHDWRRCHPQVPTDEATPGPGCGQDATANQMTGVCIGECLREMLWGWDPEMEAGPNEWFWVRENGRVKMWHQTARYVVMQGRKGEL